MKRILIAIGLALATIGALAVVRRAGGGSPEAWTPVQPS